MKAVRKVQRPLALSESEAVNAGELIAAQTHLELELCVKQHHYCLTCQASWRVWYSPIAMGCSWVADLSGCNLSSLCLYADLISDSEADG